MRLQMWVPAHGGRGPNKWAGDGAWDAVAQALLGTIPQTLFSPWHPRTGGNCGIAQRPAAAAHATVLEGHRTQGPEEPLEDF